MKNGCQHQRGHVKPEHITFNNLLGENLSSSVICVRIGNN